MTRLFYLFTIFLSTCDCYKILCLLPYHGKSHYLVFEPLLDELTNRGHELTVVSFFPSSKLHPNRRDVSLVDMAPLNVEVIDLSDIDYSSFGLNRFAIHWTVNAFLSKLNLRMCDKLINSAVFEEFVNAEGDYDLVITEHFNSDCMLGIVHNYGLPSVGLSSCTILPWTPARMGGPSNPSYVPLLILPFTEDMTFLQRVENAVMYLIFDWWYEVTIRWEEQRILETALNRKLPLLGEVGKNTSVVLVNTHHTLNGVRVMPPSYVEVGGLHLHNRTVNPLPEHVEKWVSGAKDGFIIISFGSLVRGSSLPKKRLNAILKVISGLSQRVVWKWESELMEDLPANVMLLKWLPQYDLLNHPNCVAFITHAGLLSLTEAMSVGVPTLSVAILGDQFSNAVHANKAYGAPYLTLNDLNEDIFRDRFNKVLEPKLRIQAKLLSQKWSDRPQPPMDTAVFYIEQTAKYKGLNMSSHSRHMTWVQLALLDVIAFVIIVLTVIIASFWYIYRKCIKNGKKLKVA